MIICVCSEVVFGEQYRRETRWIKRKKNIDSSGFIKVFEEEVEKLNKIADGER